MAQGLSFWVTVRAVCWAARADASRKNPASSGDVFLMISPCCAFTPSPPRMFRGKPSASSGIEESRRSSGAVLLRRRPRPDDPRYTSRRGGAHLSRYPGRDRDGGRSRNRGRGARRGPRAAARRSRRSGWAAAGQAPSRHRAFRPLGQHRAAAGDDRERPANLHGLLALRHPRQPVLSEPVGRQAVPGVGPPRRVAGGRAHLALRARLAVRAPRAALRRLSRGLGRVALAAVPAARRAPRLADAALLPPPAQGASAAGEAQRPPEARLHVDRAAGGALGADRLRRLQADRAALADGAVRRLRAGPLLALLGG